MSYSIHWTGEALGKLEKLNSPIQKRIKSKINWLAENFEQITPLPLTANLAGFFKLRVGDYRVIYTFNQDLKVIKVCLVGHRREIYED